MKFRYKKIAMTVSVIVMGIGMITLSTKIPTVDDSTALEQEQQEQKTDGQEQKGAQPEVANVNGQEDETEPKQQDITDDADEDKTDDVVETVAKDKGLEKNANPAVNELITSYMNAKLECDEKKLAELVDDVTYLDMTDIQRRTERIEEYVTIDCYTLAGPEEDSIIAYVYSEVKVSDVDTLASGLDGFYIRAGEGGKLTITMGELPDEIYQKISEAAEREDVKQLIAEVNEKFVAEIEKDEKLAAYYEELRTVEALDEENAGTEE